MRDRSYLSWPFFEPRHETLAADVDVWATQQAAAWEDDSDPFALAKVIVEELGKAGWLKLTVPAAWGGVHDALEVRSLCIGRETLAWHSGLADFCFAMQGLASAPISLSGSDALKRKFLPEVAAGKKIAALAISEADAGSDVAATATTARRDGSHYILDGTKTWISNAGIADFYVVLARTGEAPGARGLTTFVVETGTNGFDVTERIDVIAPHPLGSLRLDGCRIPASNRVSETGRGFQNMMDTLDIFRSTVGAAALGFARRALSEAVVHAKERRLFGQTLADFQLTQQRLADMSVEIDAAALLVYRAAWTKDKGARVTREAASAKMFSTEAAQRVIDSAVQLLGSAGVVSGQVVERLYRDIRPLRIYEGTTEIQKLIIARELLKDEEA